MRRIFGLGETVLDIIFKNNQPISAKAGGSILNTLVSLARVGRRCYFISELGDDNVGNTILNFLNENSINTSYIQKYNQGQSALALAFLNDNNDAEYDFYKNYPADRLNNSLPVFNPTDILLFGSTFSTSPAIREKICQIVKEAKEAGSIIIYDPNCRKVHNENQDLYFAYFKENFKFANIVRGSNDDFENIYSLTPSDDEKENLNNLCNNWIYTANKHGVFLNTNQIKKHYPVPQINPISTIGAGDNFNAGLIQAIIDKNIYKSGIESIDEPTWDYIINCGIRFSQEVCLSMDNYVGENFKA